MEGGLCRFCGAALDTKGVHANACTAGGDIIMRHNNVRNILYRYSCRGHLHPELEKVGVLEEPGVFVSMRRPADVMVDDDVVVGRGDQRTDKLALDVKIISALCPSHYNETLRGPLVAAEAYRERSFDHLQTRALCAEKGVRYEPLVFTVQGGCERHAEAIISRIAESVAKVEERDRTAVKGEILEAIALCIARAASRAVMRRHKRGVSAAAPRADRVVAELFADGDDGDL